MLSGTGKLKLAKQIRQLRQKIKSETIKGIEKLQLAKEIKSIRAQIIGGAAKFISRLDELINGKFDNLEPTKFIAIVREISQEFNEFESLKQPVVNYVEKDSWSKKQAVVSAINASREIDGLCAVFLDAFSDTKKAQLHQAKALKHKLINAKNELEKYQIWRDIVALQTELSHYKDNRLSNLAESIDLNSLKQAYIPPADLDERQRLHWLEQGRAFINDVTNHNKIQSIAEINDQIHKVLKSNVAVNEKLSTLENEYISPLAEQARNVIEQIKKNGQNDILMSEFDMLRSAIESAYNTQIDPFLLTLIQELDNTEKDQIRSYQEHKRNLGSELMSDIYEALLSRSTISQEDAELWASTQEITNSAIARMRKSGYPELEVRRDMATYYRLVNGRLNTVHIMTTGSHRASAIINSATINIDHNFDRLTLFHEMSHLLEADESIKLANQRFIKNRASGSPQKLRELTNNLSYQNDEIAIPDSFYSPYVGKIYKSGATEVASMGIQQFCSLENMYALYDSDKEMFMLMIGMMTEVNDTLIQRQKKQLLRQLTDAKFISTMKKAVKDISWQEGHRMPTDQAWKQALTGKGKIDTFNKKWGWKRTLGSCEIVPAKTEKQGKQIYAVLVNDKDGKEIQRHFFKIQFQAEIFVYLYELSIREIKPSQQDIFFLANSNRAPDWYQTGTDLPLI
ncbi:hypothetical protein PXH59_00220 (plasmid) [Xenorhabdus sp. SF857]|uniref:hypothetical protein n=1 Tax=Xenorhabdus bakwenae TaxID=3026967 RepID=UPI0025581C19|nr:hypothetical protein [Xenorhabdus sp. SF857]WFQ78107.1 hypothetical protein PXH59_00220 [Xenorhabdus sp. SF857]